MNIHEYQAKNLLKKFGVSSPPFKVASSSDEILEAIKELGLIEGGVAKAQVHAGGRGKAGGVKIASSAEELLRKAQSLLGMRICNNQTGQEGLECRKVLLTPKVSIAKEYYLALYINRAHRQIHLMSSQEGGVEIEKLAAEQPDKILTLPIQQDGTIRHYHLIEWVKFMGWEHYLSAQAQELAKSLAKCFVMSDATLIEINPLVLTKQGQLLVLDAKVTIDDNALYRHPECLQWRDLDQLSAPEQLALEKSLSYIGLDGDVGCLVNGAGLAMATMDIISHYGAKPANFLDVGGGASKEQVAHAVNIILSDVRVKKIFINIFGGIMDCKVLASGLVEALSSKGISLPVIVRMEGTNQKEGKEILRQSHLPFISVDTMEEGALACRS